MNIDHLDFTQKLRLLVCCEALQVMAKRADTTPLTVLTVIQADPHGATATYFRGLVTHAETHLPALLAQPTPAAN